MSATNHTTTIELSQYISTDKPTYLTDYNGDMLKIDNAIAADREAITAAQSKANTADGKADANKTSIDTLSEQINGDPLVPSDTGLAGAVSANTGSINTINSLIGNGEPTTTDKTIIGAINELNADIVTPETGINARVTATESAISALDGEVGDLTNLTTTEKSSVVGAINELNSGKNTIVSAYEDFPISDTTSTLNQILNGIYAQIKTFFDAKTFKYMRVNNISINGTAVYGNFAVQNNNLVDSFPSALDACRIFSDSAHVYSAQMFIHPSSSFIRRLMASTSGNTFNDYENATTDITNVRVFYELVK